MGRGRSCCCSHLAAGVGQGGLQLPREGADGALRISVGCWHRGLGQLGKGEEGTGGTLVLGEVMAGPHLSVQKNVWLINLPNVPNKGLDVLSCRMVL